MKYLILKKSKELPALILSAIHHSAFKIEGIKMGQVAQK